MDEDLNMLFQKTTVERAFELARSGSCENIGDVRKKLRLERFSRINEHLGGRQLNGELRRICKEASAPAGAARVTLPLAS